MQCQADYRKAMSEPRTLTLTRAEMEMVVRHMQTAESAYWNSGRPTPGHAAASAIVDKMAQQVGDCLGRTSPAND